MWLPCRLHPGTPPVLAAPGRLSARHDPQPDGGRSQGAIWYAAAMGDTSPFPPPMCPLTCSSSECVWLALLPRPGSGGLWWPGGPRPAGRRCPPFFSRRLCCYTTPQPGWEDTGVGQRQATAAHGAAGWANPVRASALTPLLSLLGTQSPPANFMLRPV